MNIITDATLVTVSVCSTFGAIYFGIWLRQRTRRDYLMFALGTFSVAAFSVLELAAMHASTPVEYATIVRWAHIPGWGMIVFLPWFVYFYMRAGRPWLLWSITILRTVVVVLNFILTPNINQREVISVRQELFLGEPITIAATVPNPWMIFAQFTLLLALVFFADATISAWRNGDRRRAWAVGGTTTLFFIMNLCMAVLILWRFVHWPYMVSMFFTAMIAAMAFELSSDLLRSAELGRELQEREAELRESDSALEVSAKELEDIKLALDKSSILAITDQTGKITFVNEKFCEISGYSEAELIGRDHRLINSGYHTKAFIRGIWTTIASGKIWHGEIKNRAKDGSYYWVDTTIVPFQNAADKPYQYVAVRHDITARKLAEETALDLSGRLIDAQETERSRIARELHDGLSQSLAVMSIQLDVLRGEPGDPAAIKRRVSDLVSQIKLLSSDVHRMSHELHPAKLDQLGLESALRGLCREIAAAHGFTVDFKASKVPRSLRDDVSLCLYRVTQESLQNVAKHSGANSASVRIKLENNMIYLTITDDGKGFDPVDARLNDSLGLISMRERIRLVNGTFEIESKHGGGTKIRISVPAHIN